MDVATLSAPRARGNPYPALAYSRTRSSGLRAAPRSRLTRRCVASPSGSDRFRQVTFSISKRALLIVGGLLAAAAIAVLLITVLGGAKSDEDQVRDVVTQLNDATVDEDSDTCEELFSPDSPELSEGDAAVDLGIGSGYCAINSGCSTSVIDEVDISGDRAIASFVDQLQTTELHKVDGDWRVFDACS